MQSRMTNNPKERGFVNVGVGIWTVLWWALECSLFFEFLLLLFGFAVSDGTLTIIPKVCKIANMVELRGSPAHCSHFTNGKLFGSGVWSQKSINDQDGQELIPPDVQSRRPHCKFSYTEKSTRPMKMHTPATDQWFCIHMGPPPARGARDGPCAWNPLLVALPVFAQENLKHKRSEFLSSCRGWGNRVFRSLTCAKSAGGYGGWETEPDTFHPFCNFWSAAGPQWTSNRNDPELLRPPSSPLCLVG